MVQTSLDISGILKTLEMTQLHQKKNNTTRQMCKQEALYLDKLKHNV